MPFSVSFHPGNIHPADVHPIEAPHSSGAEPGGSKHPLLAVKPEHDPFSPSSSGLPAGSSPAKSVLQKAISPDKPGDFFVKTSDVPDAHGSRPAYKRDEETGAPMLTHERAWDDGHGSWKVASHPDTAQPARRPALPPAAKIDPKQLGALKPDGTFPGGDGNSYLHRADGYHPASFDKQLQVWRINDPERPNDFSRSVPVKPDGKGGGEPLPKAANKGGGGPHPSGNTVREQLNRAQEDEQNAQSRVETAQTALDDATQRTQASLSRYNADDQRVERISDDILRMDRERQQLQQSLRREPNPVRREHIQEGINSITQRISSADGELRRANDALEQSHRQHLDNLRQENQASHTLGRHQQDLQAATRIVQQLRSLVQATPSLGR